MRIDLILQGQHIGLLFALFRFVHFLQQVADPADHPVEMAAQHPDFIVVFHIHPDIQLTALHLLH
ncbi:hypothetical protein D3C81_2267990 [compost metagenome]